METEIRLTDGEHVVQFYDADDELIGAVVGYLCGAILDGDAVVVVATPEHREALAAALREAGVDVAAALAEGRLVALDAADTSAEFLVDGAPDAAAFDEVVGGVVRAAGRGWSRRSCVRRDGRPALGCRRRHGRHRAREVVGGPGSTDAVLVVLRVPDRLRVGGSRRRRAVGGVPPPHAGRGRRASERDTRGGAPLRGERALASAGPPLRLRDPPRLGPAQARGGRAPWSSRSWPRTRCGTPPRRRRERVTAAWSGSPRGAGQQCGRAGAPCSGRDTGRGPRRADGRPDRRRLGSSGRRRGQGRVGRPRRARHQVSSDGVTPWIAPG